MGFGGVGDAPKPLDFRFSELTDPFAEAKILGYSNHTVVNGCIPQLRELIRLQDVARSRVQILENRLLKRKVLVVTLVIMSKIAQIEHSICSEMDFLVFRAL